MGATCASGGSISKGRAKEIARRFDDPHRALAFFVAWRDLHGAAQLVRDRLKEFDGRDYVTLAAAAAGAAAEALAGKQPVAATLLYRRMIESILGRASANQYGYAVRDVRNCESLAGQLPEDAGMEGHDAFMARLRKEHGARHWGEIGVHCVFSREAVQQPGGESEVDGSLNCAGYGSSVTVTATFGMVAANEIVLRLLSAP